MKRQQTTVASPQESTIRIDLDRVLDAPIIDIIVRLDTRTPENKLDVMVFGINQISAYDVRRILEAARDKLEREELERLSKQEAQNAQERDLHLANEQAGNA